VRTVFRQLKQHGQLRKQEIGMSLQTITPILASSLKLSKDFGVIVSDVWPGGPAEAAGLKEGDILVSVDGQPADNLPTVAYNFRLRDSTEKVQLVVQRGTEQKALSVAPVEQRSDFDAVSATADPERSLVPELGILGVEIDARITASATGLRSGYGIIVAARAAGANSEVPLQPNDVIRSVNDRKITTLNGLREAMRSLVPGSAVTLQIQREARLMYVSFTME
jgi:serine protease Do